MNRKLADLYLHWGRFIVCAVVFSCLFLLRFYGPVDPMGLCRVRSVYLTTHLMGRRSPLSGEPVLCTFFRKKLTTALLESAEMVYNVYHMV